jgi:hypothetical protein
MTSFRGQASWENVTEGEGEASFHWHSMPSDQKVNEAEVPTYLSINIFHCLILLLIASKSDLCLAKFVAMIAIILVNLK